MGLGWVGGGGRMLGWYGEKQGLLGGGGARQGESSRACKQGESRAVSGVHGAACTLHPAVAACTFFMLACTLILHLTSCTLHPGPALCFCSLRLLHALPASCPCNSYDSLPPAPCPLPAPSLSMQLGHHKPLGSEAQTPTLDIPGSKDFSGKQNPAQLGWSPHRDEPLHGSPSEAA